MQPTSSNTAYTMPDVASHCTAESAWVVLDKNVYDVTNFVSKHPGGAQKLLDLAGTDISERFRQVDTHDKAWMRIENLLSTMKIGFIN